MAYCTCSNLLSPKSPFLKAQIHIFLRLFWNELLSFGDISCTDVRLLSNIIELDGASLVFLKASSSVIWGTSLNFTEITLQISVFHNGHGFIKFTVHCICLKPNLHSYDMQSLWDDLAINASCLLIYLCYSTAKSHGFRLDFFQE